MSGYLENHFCYGLGGEAGKRQRYAVEGVGNVIDNVDSADDESRMVLNGQR